MCQSRTGRSISYLTFDQPRSYQGALYYDYSAAAPFSQQVSSDTRYYVTSSPSLDRISFVPADGFTGTVTVPYRCTDSSGGTYNGRVTIRVSAANGSTGSTDVSYTTSVGRSVSFKPKDFNAASIDYNGTSLDYVKFDLPAASEGVLYYNYTDSGSYSNRVGSTTRYYRSGSSPRISGITFGSRCRLLRHRDHPLYRLSRLRQLYRPRSHPRFRRRRRCQLHHHAGQDSIL